MESLAIVVSEILGFKKRDGRKIPFHLPLVKQLHRPQITFDHSKNFITDNLRYSIISFYIVSEILRFETKTVI